MDVDMGSAQSNSVGAAASEEEKKDRAAELLGDVTSREGIEDTAYQMVKTSNQLYGMIRAMEDPTGKYSHAQHRSQYDKIASFVMEYVQQKMVETYHLNEVWMPENEHVEEKYHNMPKCNIFMSPEFRRPNVEQNRQKRRALVLIQGTGAVRAGIWARSVSINESLELGSMLPFIDRCFELGIPILVMNPNFQSDPETGVGIPFSGSMGDHAMYVWEKYVLDSGFDQVSIVAHSAGGGCVSEIQMRFNDTFYDQVDKIAYTDSWVISKSELNMQQRMWMFQNAIHYIASEESLGETISLDAQRDTCPVVSAGHPRHEYTTGASQKLIMNQFSLELPEDHQSTNRQ